MPAIIKIGELFKNLKIKISLGNGIYFVVYDSTQNKDVRISLLTLVDYLKTQIITGETTFTRDFVVSLSNGKTLGKILNGQTAVLTGKTLQEGIEYLGIEDIYPTYNPASLSLNLSGSSQGEVGETLSITLTATYNQNDAGSLTAIRIQKSGSDLTPNGTSSPFSKTNSVTRIAGNVNYQAFANYNAGTPKLITPSNVPDSRTPLVRNINAPQAAENNLPSNVISISGAYKIFYGTFTNLPSNSAQVRLAPQSRFTSDSNVFILNTGSSNLNFAIWLPVGKTLSNVIDLDATNNLINFTSSSLSVADAGGNLITGTLYTNTISVPYSSNHRFQVTTN